MSRVRSVTIFGAWKSFFISDKMSLLRVLDLEDATGLRDHHLKHIGKLLHLRYLSLRGCDDIYHLPDSLGNLRELLMLDVRDTNIIKLPKSIIKLQKLNCLNASTKPIDEDISYEDTILEDMPSVLRNLRDAWTMICCGLLPIIVMHLDLYGVLAPRGMRKLKALRTLGVVNIARRGKVILQDIRKLSQLRKLRVTGINKENSKELCSTVIALSRLESLSIRSEGQPGLSGCLDGMFPFLESLQSLKLYGNLVKLPEWIQGLKNLAKLKLRSCRISEPSGAMQVLGDLPNLVSLHLLKESGEQPHLNFCLETFQSLVVLEPRLGYRIKSVKFEGGATPKLELLEIYLSNVNSSSLSGLQYMCALKEVVLITGMNSELEYVRAELALHPNPPIVRRQARSFSQLGT